MVDVAAEVPVLRHPEGQSLGRDDVRHVAGQRTAGLLRAALGVHIAVLAQLDQRSAYNTIQYSTIQYNFIVSV